MSELISTIFIAAGILANFVSSLGVVRFPDVYNQLHSATKSLTIGICFMLVGVVIRYGFTGIGVKALLAIPLIFFTSSVATHALSKGMYKFGIMPGEKTVRDDYNEVCK